MALTNKPNMKNKATTLLLLLSMPILLNAQYFEAKDVFGLEYASDPQISPDGSKIVYVRRSMDIMSDRSVSNLWILNSDGSNNRALTDGPNGGNNPVWSSDGNMLAYTAKADKKTQIFIRWMESGESMQLSNLTESPSNLSWSPDGKWIAFSMFVPQKKKPVVQLPMKPEGAEWAPPAIYVDEVTYRSDGRGMLPAGYSHIFILPIEGGTPRQLTSGDYHHRGRISWTNDGKYLLISANRHTDGDYDPRNSEIYQISVSEGNIIALTNRQGPDTQPSLSPDGKTLAYLGFDDRKQGYQLTKLYLLDLKSGNSRLLSDQLDRSMEDMAWAADSKGLFIQYTREGNGHVGFMDLKGKYSSLAGQLGGTSLGRPYGGGSFSVAENGSFAFTFADPQRPADVALGKMDQKPAVLTQLNEDLLGHKQLGSVEEIWYESSFDKRKIQGWIVKPPNFDPNKKYPLILEIHGGPFSDYDPRFSSELQLYAAAGYVVLYTNPRGSTSYGEEFGNLIHHNYPGEDYDDLISGVDAVIAKAYVDEDQLYVTGGSGGGVLSSWIIGKTNRFRAAVVAKPVINWTSFVLTADNPAFFYKYWFPGFPWDNQEHYWKRSSLSLVGNVSTPTMLLTGESDLRTPISETEQFYQALKLRKVESAMVRIPGAYHGIAARPSNLISKVEHILYWFDKYKAFER